MNDVWDRLTRQLNPRSLQPRVRQDALEVARHTTRNGDPYVVLKNRLTGTYLRVSEREYALLQLMDGSRSVADLVTQYFLQFKVLAFQRVTALIAQLRQQQFLEDGPYDAYRALQARLREQRRVSAWGDRLTQWLLGREVLLEGIDDVLDGWYRAWGRWLFTGPALWLLTLISMTGVGLFAATLWQGSQRLFRFGDSYALGFLTLLVFGLVATAIHELGHALTLKHAGREVRRAGFLFYYGIPTFFVDTTDVWMAGHRARLAVSWAGPATALIVGGFASIGGWLTLGTPVGDLLLALAFVSYLDVLVNLNPLLQLDGYYILVDALERPMLRQQALAFARHALVPKLRRRESFTKDERFLTLFGLSSATWSLFSVYLALYLWEARIVNVARELARGEGWWPRLMLAALALVLVASVWLVVRFARQQVWPFLVRRWRLLGRQGAAFRRRETIRLLRGFPFLRNMPEGRLAELAARLQPIRVLPGEKIVQQGDVGDYFYLVASGQLEVVKDNERVAMLGPGSYFGEIALLRDVPRTSSVRARSTTRVLALSGVDFRTLMAHELQTFERLRSRLEAREELARCPLLAGVSPLELDLLLTKVEERAFEPGATIVRQGEPGDGFYLIRSGEVEVVSNRVRLCTLRGGEYFGEIAALTALPRTATVRAIGEAPTRTWVLDRDDVHDVLGRYLGLETTLEHVGQHRLQQALSH